MTAEIGSEAARRLIERRRRRSGERQGEIGRCSAGNEVKMRGAAAKRSEAERAADGRTAGVRARGSAAAPGGRPTEPSWLGRDAGAARGREPESNPFEKTS